jgi:hypothetical protein
MKKSHLVMIMSVGCALLSGLPAYSQTKSCFDQWYALRQNELKGIILSNSEAAAYFTPSLLAREDIAACEASPDKIFRKIKSAGEGVPG